MPPGTWDGRARVWIEIAGHGTLGPGKFRLLRAIDATKSISAAARQMRMSYRLAWEHLRTIERRTGIRVVEPHRGGQRGGGTELTARGKALLESYESFRREVEASTQSAADRFLARWSSPRSSKS